MERFGSEVSVERLGASPPTHILAKLIAPGGFECEWHIVSEGGCIDSFAVSKKKELVPRFNSSVAFSYLFIFFVSQSYVRI